jgi:RNA polymerase sigma factor (sigma-70 family)
MAAPMRSDAEVHRLVNDNRRLVDYMVNRYLKRYYVPSMERDDLVSWGMMGLVNAARAWDPARSNSFSTLACRAIERMIIRGVNREWHPEEAHATLSLDELMSGDGESGSDRFIDQLPADENIERTLMATERSVSVKSALETLPEEQRRLIERHYLEDESVQQIAAELGLTRQGVYSREKLIFKRLRERLGDSHALAN